MLNNKDWPVLTYAIAVLLLLMLAELLAILWLNQGVFVFSLDDPYIHLALAENLLHGHYGVNLQEYSAPSSSILWPLLIAPFSAWSAAGWYVLLLNTVFAVCSLWAFDRILLQAERYRKTPLKPPVRFGLLLAFIVMANLIGLAFTGMEHSLQVLLALLVLLGLLKVVNGDRPSGGLWLAIVLIPLIRYETAALSGAALLFLLAQRYYWQAIASGAVLALLLLLFSVFLLSLGLGYLPDSVLAKSDVAASGIAKLLQNMERNLTLLTPAPKGFFLLLGAIFLVGQGLQATQKSLRYLLWSVALAIVLHLLGGRIGWFWRYELYIWVVLGSLVLFLALTQQKKIQRWFTALLLLISLEHVIGWVVTPMASSNIYLQQYQMHRFITGYYQKPVAVNDLGWPSFHNPYYVLDLWGLGSSQARQLRKSGEDIAWMDKLATEHDVDLIMIYHHPIWFPAIPENWIKLGELDSDRMRITARMPVSFYSRCQSCIADMQGKLAAFAASLPDGAVFIRSGSVAGAQ